MGREGGRGAVKKLRFEGGGRRKEDGVWFGRIVVMCVACFTKNRLLNIKIVLENLH